MQKRVLMIMKKIQIPMRKTLRTVRILRRLKDLRILLKIQGILMMKIQLKVLHVARTDLDHIDLGVNEQRDVLVVHQFGHDGLACDLRGPSCKTLQTLSTQTLEAVRAGAGLERAAAQDAGPGGLHALGHLGSGQPRRVGGDAVQVVADAIVGVLIGVKVVACKAETVVCGPLHNGHTVGGERLGIGVGALQRGVQDAVVAALQRVVAVGLVEEPSLDIQAVQLGFQCRVGGSGRCTSRPLSAIQCGSGRTHGPGSTR